MVNATKKNGHQLRHEKTRIKIIEASKSVFLEKGYVLATVTSIARKANVGYGTVYAHFPKGKEELLLYIMEDIMGEFYDIAERKYTPKSKEEAFKFTFTNVKDFLELAINYKSWLEVFYEAIAKNDQARTKWDEITNRFIERISRNVEVVREKGLIRNEHYHSQVVAGILFYSGEKFLWELARGKSNKDYIDIATTLTEMYTNGLYK